MKKNKCITHSVYVGQYSEWEWEHGLYIFQPGLKGLNHVKNTPTCINLYNPSVCLLHHSIYTNNLKQWDLDETNKPVILTHQCLERQPSRSGMGWHKHCHISGQRHTGNISRVLIHFCVDLAIATVGHKQHGENLYAPQPKAQRGRSNEMDSVSGAPLTISAYNYKECNSKPTWYCISATIPVGVHPKSAVWLHTC